MLWSGKGEGCVVGGTRGVGNDAVYRDPIAGYLASLESSFKWSVLLSVSRIHVATHPRDTNLGTRAWKRDHPHSNTWSSGWGPRSDSGCAGLSWTPFPAPQ